MAVPFLQNALGDTAARFVTNFCWDAVEEAQFSAVWSNGPASGSLVRPEPHRNPDMLDHRMQLCGASVLNFAQPMLDENFA